MKQIIKNHVNMIKNSILLRGTIVPAKQLFENGTLPSHIERVADEFDMACQSAI